VTFVHIYLHLVLSFLLLLRRSRLRVPSATLCSSTLSSRLFLPQTLRLSQTPSASVSRRDRISLFCGHAHNARLCAKLNYHCTIAPATLSVHHAITHQAPLTTRHDEYRMPVPPGSISQPPSTTEPGPPLYCWIINIDRPASIYVCISLLFVLISSNVALALVRYRWSMFSNCSSGHFLSATFLCFVGIPNMLRVFGSSVAGPCPGRHPQRDSPGGMG